MSDRNIADLLPTVAKAAQIALDKLKTEGVDTLITCTYRSDDEQEALYQQGRTTKGPVVTNAKPGQSMHQFRCALDIYPVVNGKIDFAGAHTDVWKKIADAFKSEGFEWGYEWKTFKEMPHFQMTGGHPLQYFQNGGKI
jgi:peptidoglycan LD-endopeptidase CwlK